MICEICNGDGFDLIHKNRKDIDACPRCTLAAEMDYQRKPQEPELPLRVIEGGL